MLFFHKSKSLYNFQKKNHVSCSCIVCCNQSKGNGPPDLEEIFRNFFKSWRFRNCKESVFNVKKSFFKRNNFYFFIVFLCVIFLFFFGSGFYTIKEAERGVILRFGKFYNLVHPGLNWKIIFIDTLYTVNVESVQELAAFGVMLTSDENVVHVEMNVQYRIFDPRSYLFSVTNAHDSLRQATDSALRGVIGKYTMDRILTEGRTLVRNDTQRILEDIIRPYNMGIMLLDVNFQTARPPEEVKAAFDDAIAARENEQQYIREAEAYVNEVQPRANGKAQRILEEGRSYKIRSILNAKGEVQRFIKMLPEYQAAPEIMKERLYINTMERVLSNTNKILVSNEKNNIVVFGNQLVAKEMLNDVKNCKRNNVTLESNKNNFSDKYDVNLNKK
ncbi:Modulator of FtsH protease HflK [Candidatus Westeberhardia cardiocondylae]|uniref:Protein HflK n=2 Tax=Candidatus Westeberhardia cardiocondylae TaxID=1594731 RepID=A0A0H5C5C0_9ENTR|nr:Modulator of FtsH protease HflK [Candidatus Westeberhardia cardiocondylae]